MSIALSLHVLFVSIWVGGMFFAYMILRPIAAQQLEPELRLNLWLRIFKRFFPWVWLAVIILPITGYIMIKIYGGMANIGLYIHIMHGLGWLMIFLFIYLFFIPFKQLEQSVINKNWPIASTHLNKMRIIIGLNLGLGLLVVTIATLGRYYLKNP